MILKMVVKVSKASFYRWSGGPRVNGMEPILVIFEDRKEKEQVWAKLRDNLRTKTNIVVTQDSSSKVG